MKTKISYSRIKEISYEFDRSEIEQKLSEEIDKAMRVGAKQSIDFFIDDDGNVKKAIITCLFSSEEIEIPQG
jgi:hypothetical protein